MVVVFRILKQLKCIIYIRRSITNLQKKPVSIIQQVSLLDESDKSEDEGLIKEENKKRSGMEINCYLFI